MSELKTIKLDEGKLEFQIDPAVMDDVDVIEMLGDVQTEPLAIVKLLKAVLGEETYKTVKAHYAKEHGRMSVTKDLPEVLSAVFEVFPKSQA